MECKLQVEAFLRTFDSLGIDGSELGRPALAGLSSLTTKVEETIAKGQLLDDVMAEMMAIKRSAPTRAVTSISRAIDERQQRLTRLMECVTESLVLQREILLLVALEEMSYEEVAATLGLPLGTVMSRLSRARQK